MKDSWGSDKGDKMRSGGPKLLCSPSFSIGAILVLLIVTYKYYTLSTEHDNILLKVGVLQNQMKLTASNMRNLDTSLTRKEEAFSECMSEKKNLEDRTRVLETETAQKEEDMKKLQNMNDEAAVLVKKLRSEIERLGSDNHTMTEELKYLRRRNEELGRNEEECRKNEAKINQLEGELNTLREEASALHAQNIQAPAANLPRGELPDVNPGAVNIKQPALNGTSMVGHGVPILPHVDPDAPKAEPEVHLNVPNANDEAVRAEIIKEEEENDQLDQNDKEKEEEVKNAHLPDAVPDHFLNEKNLDIHDLANAYLPKPEIIQPKDEHEGFFAKKAKYAKKPATETFLDFKLLKRDQLAKKMSEETAVLKQPLDLKKLNENHENSKAVDDAMNNVVDYEEREHQPFPDEPDKRDPAVVLQDPRARDQDNDARIFDAVQDGFAKKNRWRLS